MRYRLRALLILLGIGPPLLAGAWFLARGDYAWMLPALAISAIAFVARVLTRANEPSCPARRRDSQKC